MTSERHQMLAGLDSRNFAAPIRQILAGIAAHAIGAPIARVLTHGVIGAAAFRPRCMPPSLALWFIPRRTIVDQYVALDVSLQKTAVCVLNVSGRVLIEADVPSEPAALIAFIQTHAPPSGQGWIGKR